MKQIPYKDTFLTLMHYKEPLLPVKDGFGYQGCLLSTMDGEKVLCSICGELFRSLGTHVYLSHHMTARDYKEKFGLSYQTALISESERTARQERTMEWAKQMQKKYGLSWRKVMLEFSAKGREMSLKNRAEGKTIQPKASLEQKNKRGVCPDQLLTKIREVADKLGHTPSKDEFIHITGTQRYVHLIYKTFGSWTNALKKLHLIPKVHNSGKGETRKYWDDEELLEHLVIFFEEHKKIPTETDCKRGQIPPAETYRRHFGSLPKARERAGIEGRPTRFGIK